MLTAALSNNGQNSEVQTGIAGLGLVASALCRQRQYIP